MDKTLENILKLMGSEVGAQRRFTNGLGLCASTVNDWKSGKSKSYIKHLPKIAAYFNTTVDEILTGEPLHKKKAVMIPVLGTVRAGCPINAEENIEGYEPADVEPHEEYFYLKVKGDSMIGAGISDGSLVLVHKQSYAENGQIVVCLMDNDYATLKRYRRKNSTILLLPENPAYQPYILSYADFESGSAAILGVAVEVKKKLI